MRNIIFLLQILILVGAGCFIVIAEKNSSDYLVWAWVILLFAVIIAKLIDVAKCPICSKISRSNGHAGSKYSGYYCSRCKKSFWKEHFEN